MVSRGEKMSNSTNEQDQKITKEMVEEVVKKIVPYLRASWFVVSTIAASAFYIGTKVTDMTDKIDTQNQKLTTEIKAQKEQWKENNKTITDMLISIKGLQDNKVDRK